MKNEIVCTQDYAAPLLFFPKEKYVVSSCTSWSYRDSGYEVKYLPLEGNLHFRRAHPAQTSANRHVSLNVRCDYFARGLTSMRDCDIDVKWPVLKWTGSNKLPSIARNLLKVVAPRDSRGWAIVSSGITDYRSVAGRKNTHKLLKISCWKFSGDSTCLALSLSIIHMIVLHLS